MANFFSPQFKRFVDLPPELRVLIWKEQLHQSHTTLVTGPLNPDQYSGIHDRFQLEYLPRNANLPPICNESEEELRRSLRLLPAVTGRILQSAPFGSLAFILPRKDEAEILGILATLKIKLGPYSLNHNAAFLGRQIDKLTVDAHRAGTQQLARYWQRTVYEEIFTDDNACLLVRLPAKPSLAGILCEWYRWPQLALSHGRRVNHLAATWWSIPQPGYTVVENLLFAVAFLLGAPRESAPDSTEGQNTIRYPEFEDIRSLTIISKPTCESVVVTLDEDLQPGEWCFSLDTESKAFRPEYGDNWSSVTWRVGLGYPKGVCKMFPEVAATWSPDVAKWEFLKEKICMRRADVGKPWKASLIGDYAERNKWNPGHRAWPRDEELRLVAGRDGEVYFGPSTS